MRSEREAEADFRIVACDGESLLANCSCKPAEETFTLGTSDMSYRFITDARLVYMSANNNTKVLSVSGDCMTSIRLGRKRLKHTLGYSFRRAESSEALDYPSVYVSGAVARAVADRQSGAIPTCILHSESTVAIKYVEPHEDSGLGALVPSRGFSERGLRCAECGQSAGFCFESGDELWEVCRGCERSFSAIVSE